MYTAKDGKNFQNESMGRHYDSTRPKPKHESGMMKEPEGEQEEDMGQVVQEHGPAEQMEMHSTHADGHKHKSTHHDSHSAHAHVSKAFGEEEQEPMGEQMPMHSGAIPGMMG